VSNLIQTPSINERILPGSRHHLRVTPRRNTRTFDLVPRIDSQNDIIQVASVLQGRGVFQNVPATRRQGLEAGAQYQTGQYLVYANYAYIDATYQFSGTLASPNNPFADAGI
jgi:hypothetical protein